MEILFCILLLLSLVPGIYCALNTLSIILLCELCIWKGYFFSAFLFFTSTQQHYYNTDSMSIYAFNGENAFRFITKDIENTFSSCGDEGRAIK